MFYFLYFREGRDKKGNHTQHPNHPRVANWSMLQGSCSRGFDSPMIAADLATPITMKSLLTPLADIDLFEYIKEMELQTALEYYSVSGPFIENSKIS